MYLTAWTISTDEGMRARVSACYATEVPTSTVRPEQWAYEQALYWATAPGWSQAWEYAAAAGNPDPGSDPTVITDGMILAQVQLLLAPEPPEPPEPPEV